MSKKAFNHISATRLKERGVVSITVTMILMVVLSLLVIGFAQVSRRNQRVALDQQLSTQAFYAAESGINAARAAIKAAGAGATIPAKTSCNTGAGIFATLNGTVNNAVSGVSYSCLLVDPAPPTLTYSSIDDQGTIIPLNAAAGNITNLRLTWKTPVPNPLTGCPTGTNKVFSASSSWGCGYGLIRFDLVPTDASFDINELSNGAMTTFAVPVSGGAGTISYAPGSSNDVTAANCTAAQCTLTVNVPSPHASFYMRIRSLYKPSSLEIAANTNLKGAQALVDVTGKAQDVLRRVQVRIPLSDTGRNRLPDYAMQSRDSICKRFSIMGNYFATDPAVEDFSNDANGGNPLCKLITVSAPVGGADVAENSPDDDAGADLDSCREGCSGGSGGGNTQKSWSRHFKNTSPNNGSAVLGCTWTFGDGKSETNKACNTGDVISHHYAEDNNCKVYTVTVTLRLANGKTPSKTRTTYVPHGDGTRPC